MLLPSCPDSMYIHSLRNIDNKLYVGVVVVVRASRNLLLVISVWLCTV